MKLSIIIKLFVPTFANVLSHLRLLDAAYPHLCVQCKILNVRQFVYSCHSNWVAENQTESSIPCVPELVTLSQTNRIRPEVK